MIQPFYRILNADVAAVLGVCKETINRYVRENRLPPFEAPISRRAGRFWLPATLRAHNPDLARLVERYLIETGRASAGANDPT